MAADWDGELEEDGGVSEDRWMSVRDGGWSDEELGAIVWWNAVWFV